MSRHWSKVRLTSDEWVAALRKGATRESLLSSPVPADAHVFVSRRDWRGSVSVSTPLVDVLLQYAVDARKSGRLAELAELSSALSSSILPAAPVHAPPEPVRRRAFGAPSAPLSQDWSTLMRLSEIPEPWPEPFLSAFGDFRDAASFALQIALFGDVGALYPSLFSAFEIPPRDALRRLLASPEFRGAAPMLLSIRGIPPFARLLRAEPESARAAAGVLWSHEGVGVPSSALRSVISSDFSDDFDVYRASFLHDLADALSPLERREFLSWVDILLPRPENGAPSEASASLRAYAVASALSSASDKTRPKTPSSDRRRL